MFIKVNLFVENISIHIFVAQIKNKKWGYKTRRVGRVVAIAFCEVPLKAENAAIDYVYILKIIRISGVDIISVTQKILRKELRNIIPNESALLKHLFLGN